MLCYSTIIGQTSVKHKQYTIINIITYIYTSYYNNVEIERATQTQVIVIHDQQAILVTDNNMSVFPLAN